MKDFIIEILNNEDIRLIILAIVATFATELKGMVLFLFKFLKSFMAKKIKESEETIIHTKLLSEGLKIQAEIDQLRVMFNARNVNVCIFHNSIYDFRGVGFESYSMRFQSIDGVDDHIINDYQNKPLSTMYKTIEAFRKEHVKFITYKSKNGEQVLPFMNRNDYNYLVCSLIIVDRRLVGMLNMIFTEMPPENSIHEQLEIKVNNIVRIYKETPELNILNR